MNNGVNNNQNLNAEPVLTPIDTNTAAPQTEQPAQAQPTVVPNAVPVQPAAVYQQQAPTPQPAQPQVPTPVETAPVVEPAPIPVEATPVVEQPKTNEDSYQATTNIGNINNTVNQQDEYVPQPEDLSNINIKEYDEEPKKKKFSITPILLLIIIGLGGYLLYSTKTNQSKIDQLNAKCTPVTSYKEEKELDIESTLVQDLYSKVHTNIREDIAQPEWNDTMKLYLAYRQVKEKDKYESNCNMFNPSLMEPYTCEESTTFVPKAFKTSTLLLEWKKLFGEETPVELGNIKLTNSCIGGYEYIQERDEYVEGYCDVQTATSFKVDKKLSKATTYRNTIILTETVKYHESEKMPLPEYLKSGDYIYTFKLDMNYNYVLIDKVYDDKYS